MAIKFIILSTTGAGNWTVPNDWNSKNNTIHLFGAGGNNYGGGGGYTRINAFSAIPGTSVSYFVGAGVASSDGQDTTFASEVYVAGGGKRSTGVGILGAGGIGGTFNGGSGRGQASGAAGGAAGPNGNGQDAPDNNTSGAGDAGFGGASVTAGGAGNPGTNLFGVGAGSGAQGGSYVGGAFGGGGGSGSSRGGHGGIVIQYDTATPPSGFNKDDSTFGTIDLDDEYVTDAWLIDQFVGNALYAWGQDAYGQLGLRDIIPRSSPVQVGSLTNWKSAAGDSHTLAISTDGKLWAWGQNNNGQLGLINVTFYSSPVQVGALTNWKQVSAGGFSGHSLAVKTDGTLWTWGHNAVYGQLGLGDITNRSSPTQVGSLKNWKQVIATHSSSYAIRQDGTLWAWGYNGLYGQLGQNNLTSYSSPVQVGSLTNWKQIGGTSSFGVSAIKTDGTLWTLGANDYGQLGLGDIIPRSSPTQVGSLTNWKQVNVARQHTVGVKTDGTLWAWGGNGAGQLGLGDVILRSSPVQVGALTNWKSAISAGPDTSYAVKTDGTLWSWGYGLSGKLGLGDIISRSSPVQVGLLTNWKYISCGYSTGLGISFADIT